jgi:Subtilase family
MTQTFIPALKKVKNFLAILLLVQINANAQVTRPLENTGPYRSYTEPARRVFNPDKPHYLSFEARQLPGFVKITRWLDEKTAIVQINSVEEFNVLSHQYSIVAANDQWKYAASLAKEIPTLNKNLNIHFILTAVDTGKLQEALDKLPAGSQVVSINNPSNSLVVKCRPSLLMSHIVSLKEVIFIDRYVEAQPEIAIIGYRREFHGINRLDYLLPAANGMNITTGVKEQRMEAADLDLHKRVLNSPIASPTVSNHATVVSSIIGGAGNSFYNGRGIAHGTKLFPSSFSNLFADDATILNTNNVTVQNHSYGTIVQQFYGAEAVSYDLQTWQNKNFLHIFSAGNSGKLAASEGKYAGITNYANLTGNFKMAKNIIAVAAVENTGTVPAESSSGPAYDGRLVPQLTALGPNGTSDAAAIVSGTIAVMQQVYKDSNSQALPGAALVKAVLFNTAEDIYNTGIDYKTGYGSVNSFSAVRTIQQKYYDGSALSQNQSWTKNITIPVNAAQFKLTLAWTDTASQVNNNNKALVNDLDLELTEISSGAVYRPWVLSTAANADSLAKLPTRKRDSLNTAEQISLQLPNPGTYQVKVTGAAVANAPMPFHIAYNTDTLNTFVFTNPMHTSDVNRAENALLSIKWRTFVADTNQTGNLSISYDNGTSWQLIKAAHKIYTNQYDWPIKDTVATGMLRMETSFGNFFSRSFIISPVIDPEIDFICADSFQMSWNRHLYATGYKIYALTDSPYLKHIFTVTDTFKLVKRTDHPYLVYAVEPVLSNNIPAARSVAFDIEMQGVQCFYRTFYYNQLDLNNINLVLELSAPTFLDSIYFEGVTAQGILLQTYGGTNVLPGTAQYLQLVTNLSRGNNYFRARIKLKNGVIIYTGIISLLSSGKEMIVFYPNPARRSGSLNYVLMQGIPADNRIQFFDVTGRMIKNFASMPTIIDISNFPTGIVIYKLFGSDNKQVQTGKLVIYE